jgi:hypothetical protein
MHLDHAHPDIVLRSGPQLEELCRDVTHCSCAYGNVVVFYSAAEPDSTYCDRNAKAVIEYARNYPSGLGMLVLIAADEPPPSEASRRAIQQSYIDMQAVIRAGVLVVEGEGFAASAKRSVITLVNLSANLPFPMKVAGSVDEGAAKLVKMLGARLDPGLNLQLMAAAIEATKTRLR